MIVKNSSKISSAELIDYLSENNLFNYDTITENDYLNSTPIKKKRK